MKKYFFIFLAVGLIFSSCKKDTAAIQMDAAVQHIPSDASQVTVIRIPQLMEKIGFESLREMDFYQQAMKEAAGRDQTMGKILYDPSESGINMKENAYIISDINPSNPSDMMNGVMVNIADGTKFAELMKSSPMSIGIKDATGYQYSTTGDNLLAWNDEIAFIGQVGGGGGVTSKLDKIFNISEGASVLNSNGFAKTGGGTDDINFMLSSDALGGSPQVTMAAGLMGWSLEDLVGNYINGGVKFDEKKMSVDLDIDLKKAIAIDLAMPFKSSVSTDFSSYIPGDNLAGVFTFGLNLRGLNQLLVEKGAEGMANSFANLDRMGLSMEELTKAIDGDMVLAIQKEGSEGKPAGIFAMSINEKEFKAFAAKMVEMGIIADKGNGVYKINNADLSKDFDDAMGGNGEFNEASIVIKDGKLFMTADPVLLEGIKNGGLAKGKRMDKSLYKEISSGFLGGKGFPEQLKGMDLGIDKMDIESFVFNIKSGKITMELTSDKAGNFLKTMVESAEKQQGKSN
jgi:hypothetical protein